MLPYRSPRMLAFVAPATEGRALWRTLSGVLLTIFAFLALASGSIAVVLFVGEAIQLGLGYKLILQMQSGQGAVATLMQLALIAAITPVLWLSLRLFHKRPLSSLFGPTGNINWRYFCVAALIVILISGPDFLLSGLFGQLIPAMSLGAWLPWVLPATAILFLQVLAEELFFRGYLLQQLGARFKSRWIWWVLPAALFGLLHYNPSGFGDGPAIIVVLTTFFMGLVLADVTARFGNLGPALGMHFANNFVVLLIVGVPQQLSGLSLYLRDLPSTQPDELFSALVASMGLMIVLYFIYLLIMRRRGL